MNFYNKAKLIWAAQGLHIIIAAWFLNCDQASGGFSTIEGILLIPILIAFPATGVLGLVQAMRYKVAQGKHDTTSLLLLITSIIMMTWLIPTMISHFVGDNFLPFSRNMCFVDDTLRYFVK